MQNLQVKVASTRLLSTEFSGEEQSSLASEYTRYKSANEEATTVFVTTVDGRSNVQMHRLAKYKELVAAKDLR